MIMRRVLVILMVFCSFVVMTVAQTIWPYRDASLPIETRVADLLARMTTEEKVGQLRCTMAWNYHQRDGKSVRLTEQFKKDVIDGHVGMLWATFRADPWTQKSLDTGLYPELAASCSNDMQRYVMQHSRLGIPLFLAEEAPHGHMAIGSTVFPTGLGMAATWSPVLMEKVGRIIAKEVRLQGAHVSYGPVMDLSRDPRWSRVEESMGEDPVLTAEMACALIRGMGGGRIRQPFSTVVTPKHFVAYGTTEGGHNGGPTVAGLRDLMENFAWPFKKAVDAGALSVMTSYNSIDGVPSTCNEFLLDQVLRKQWGFRGFVVSDLYSINGICNTHQVAATVDEAGSMALKAGVDVDLGALGFAQLGKALEKGGVSEAQLDTAVARVLRMKFEMGLFDHPYVEVKAAREVGNEASRQVALDVARASVTLLKNENRLLPLNQSVKVAVVGPNADSPYNQLGDYTAPQEAGRVKTVLDGIRAKLPDTQVTFAKGCAVRDTSNTDLSAAVVAARDADVVIVVVGGSSARDFKTSYQETGAAEMTGESMSDMECGEGFDRASLDLLGHQQQLLEAIRQTGKPMVVVYLEGRPLNKNWAAQQADALLTAYYPGQEGGLAVADVLFGDYNPAGRLPISVPMDVGQLPVYYNRKSPLPQDYADMTAQPLYPFGYGLSYTHFTYSRLETKRKGGRQYEISFDVTNDGEYDGEEVAQLYLHDEVASTVRPVRQLRRFERVFIPKGATKKISFLLDEDDWALVDSHMKWCVEPGSFHVMIGASSQDIRLDTMVEVE